MRHKSEPYEVNNSLDVWRWMYSLVRRSASGGGSRRGAGRLPRRAAAHHCSLPHAEVRVLVRVASFWLARWLIGLSKSIGIIFLQARYA